MTLFEHPDFDHHEQVVFAHDAASGLKATVNLSINQTLSRTVITSGLTWVVVFGLFLFGGAALNPFAFVLSVGVLVGTYSSIFVASPALIEIQQRWGLGSAGEKKKKPQPATV